MKMRRCPCCDARGSLRLEGRGYYSCSGCGAESWWAEDDRLLRVRLNGHDLDVARLVDDGRWMMGLYET